MTRRAIPIPQIEPPSPTGSQSPWGEDERSRAGEPARNYTPPSAQKSRRVRKWEQSQAAQGRVVTSYRLPADLRDEITKLGRDRLHVPVDDLARVLLEYALEQYQNGALQLHPKPKEGRFTL